MQMREFSARAAPALVARPTRPTSGCPEESPPGAYPLLTAAWHHASRLFRAYLFFFASGVSRSRAQAGRMRRRRRALFCYALQFLPNLFSFPGSSPEEHHGTGGAPLFSPGRLGGGLACHPGLPSLMSLFNMARVACVAWVAWVAWVASPSLLVRAPSWAARSPTWWI